MRTCGGDVAEAEVAAAFDPAEVIAAWAGDPVLFVRQAFGAEPEEWQAKALAAVVTEDRIAIRSGHGVGKTAFLAWAILWWMLTRYPARVACTAPTAPQLEINLWGELALWSRKMPPGLRELIEVKADKVVMTAANRGESAAYARTSSKERPEALQGFHSPNMLFVVDEASGVDDIVFEVAQGSLTTPGAKILMTGNPTRRGGYFYSAFNGPNADGWWKLKVSQYESTQATAESIAWATKEYGPESNKFRIRVLGEFPESDEDVVVPPELAESAVGRDVMATGPVVWGLDVARYGDDRSVLVKRQGRKVLPGIKVWRKLDLMQLAAKVVEEFKAEAYERRPSEVLVDVIGLGAGVVDRLRQLNSEGHFPPLVRGINVSEASSMSDRFLRLRDELWWNIRDWLATREASLPNDPELVKEICSPTYMFTSGTQRIKVESKDEMRARGADSPDLADALMLTFASTGATMHYGASGWNRRRVRADTGWVV